MRWMKQNTEGISFLTDILRSGRGVMKSRVVVCLWLDEDAGVGGIMCVKDGMGYCSIRI